MAETEQTKAKKEPTVLHALGAGVLIGLIVSAIVFWEWQRTLMENLIDIKNSLPGFSGILLVCIIGAIVGRTKSKNLKGLWLGAIIPLAVWGLIALLGTLLFPGY